MEKFRKITEKIDGLSIRERAIVFIGIILIIFTVWDSFLMKPLETEQKKLIVNLNNKNAERLVLSTKLQKLLTEDRKDPNADSLKELRSLRSQLVNIQAELESSTDSLVSPKDMPKILETVLHKTGGLTLVSLKSLGVTPLVTKEESVTTSTKNEEQVSNTGNKLTADNIDNAYRHGLRIEFQGDYLTTLNYVKGLEELEWSFFWDKFQLTVSEYPDANSSIEIFTLSLKQEWIGV